MYIHNKYVEYPGFPVRNMMYIYIYTFMVGFPHLFWRGLQEGIP